MAMFYAQYNRYVEKKRRGEFEYACYFMEAGSYHDAMKVFGPLRSYIRDQRGDGWNLDYVSETPETRFSYQAIPQIDDKYFDMYYEPVHDYEVMSIEGTRLLELKSDGKADNYGAYVRNRDTGETSYACANGQFFTHDEIQMAMKKIHKRAPKYDPTAPFRWKPILFPYTEAKSADSPFSEARQEPCVDLGDYVKTTISFAFPIQFWGHESYDKQLLWLMKQEGL